MAKKIQLIVSSTRQNRIADDKIDWLHSQLAKNKALEIEIVDLKKEGLPFFDSPVSPMYAPDESEAGKAWAAKIGGADGYVFLTPEYNRSVPASLKNAIDFLYAEWNNKPAAIISYGWIDGGGSAAKHLGDILSWLKMQVVEPAVAIKLSPEIMDEQNRISDPNASLKQYEADIAKITEALAK